MAGKQWGVLPPFQFCFDQYALQYSTKPTAQTAADCKHKTAINICIALSAIDESETLVRDGNDSVLWTVGLRGTTAKCLQAVTLQQ